MAKLIHTQDYVTCPFCGDVANFYYLRTDSVDNRRVFKCLSDEYHICEIDEDLFWEQKNG